MARALVEQGDAGASGEGSEARCCERDWGIVGVWCGLLAPIGVRLLTCLVRFSGPRWAVTGAR